MTLTANPMKKLNKPKRKLVRRRVLDDDSDDDVPIAHIAKKAKGNDRGPLAQRYCFTFNNPSIAGEDFAEFLSEECEDITMAIFKKKLVQMAQNTSKGTWN